MKVLHKAVDGGILDVGIRSEADEFAAALNEAYLEATETYPVPGFAAGLAPREEIEKVYGEHALYDEAVDILVPRLYRDFIAAEGLLTVGTPTLEALTWEDDGGISFDVRAALMPAVELGQYTGIACPYARDDAETFEGFVLARAVGNMKVKLTEAFVDLKLDALEAQEKMRVGRDPIYYVLADSVYALREGYYLAEITRSKAQIDAEAMDIMLRTVSKDNAEVTPELFIALVAEAVERYHALPEGFAEQLAEKMQARSLKKKGMDDDALMEEAFKAYLGSVEMNRKQWREHMREEAAKEACVDLLLEAVARKEGLSVGRDELIAAIADIAAQAGMDLEEALPQVDEESIRHHLLRERARAFILESAVEA